MQRALTPRSFEAYTKPPFGYDELFLQHVADRLNDELRLLQMDIVRALFGDPKFSMR